MRALSKLIYLNNPDLVLFVGEALVGNDAVDQLSKFNQVWALKFIICFRCPIFTTLSYWELCLLSAEISGPVSIAKPQAYRWNTAHKVRYYRWQGRLALLTPCNGLWYFNCSKHLTLTELIFVGWSRTLHGLHIRSSRHVCRLRAVVYGPEEAQREVDSQDTPQVMNL